MNLTKSAYTVHCGRLTDKTAVQSVVFVLLPQVKQVTVTHYRNHIVEQCNCCGMLILRSNRVKYSVSPRNRAHVTSYCRSIATTAQSRVVSDTLQVGKCRDLELGGQRSLKVINNGIILYIMYGFLPEFYRNSCREMHGT